MDMLGVGADVLAELYNRIEAGRIDGHMWRSLAVASSVSICLRSRASS
jgi:hypothetical protein